MTPTQKQAFFDASGMHASGLTFDIRLIAGSVALICALIILVGLMHYLHSDAVWDKHIFVVSIFALAFVLMMIFIYIA